MVALAGIAGEYRRKTGDVYLAGLWKTDLHEQLCWYYSIWETRDRHLRLSGIPYNAPTWSWTSPDYPVTTDSHYYSPNPHRACFVKIDDVSVDTDGVTKLRDFTAGELQIRAIALKGRVLLSRIRRLKNTSNKYQRSKNQRKLVLLRKLKNSWAECISTSTRILVSPAENPSKKYGIAL
ncbi:hypothetical protein BCR34DRAFT_555156 [Clohesyomyces aquaticus]|uniref:Heterokaryon incompatibility domain-containing protein n=1 Tax=Clohesyomyces aquaticus TaxID=1231657 RepID=A0A1Y2A5K0_9PLEO|nr:hypothetical protein BCR34DRAFT_555156 [Clohesyomyces aquaticus]